MFSAEELARQMQRRHKLAGFRMRLLGENWSQWLARMPLKPGAIRGATAAAIIATLAARPLRSPEPAGTPLGPWQGLRAAFRQSVDAPGLHDRRERRIAWSVSLLGHALLFVVLAWLGGLPPPPPGASPQGDDVLQVMYIGIGAPDDGGAGAEQPDEDGPPRSAAAPLAQASPDAVAQPRDVQDAAAPAAPSMPPAEVQVDLMAEPEPDTTPVITAQPLQVTEVPQPDTDFVLPPITAPGIAVDTPRMPVREVAARQREVEVAEQPELPSVAMPIPAPRTEVRTTQIPQPQVVPRERQVELGPQVEVPRVQAPPSRVATPAPRVATPDVQVRGREVAVSPSALQSGRSSASASASTGTASTGDGREAASSGPPASSSGTRPAAANGSGSSASSVSGGWPSTRPGDDWGDADRAQAGGRPGTRDGLFGADGRPRLPPGTAAAGGGFPPGSDGWDRQMLDRHGTWMTRPPNDYNPTRFDQYWMPSGNLLEEWVRRGVRNLEIPVPGTSKRIRCVISVLQLGGGCGVVDPNLQDQPATARPAPDIPWKPELQED